MKMSLLMSYESLEQTRIRYNVTMSCFEYTSIYHFSRSPEVNINQLTMTARPKNYSEDSESSASE